MEVEEVHSRSASVVHRNGDNCCSSRLDRVFFGPSRTNHICAFRCKTRLKPLLSPPMLSHPYDIPPGVVNNPKSQTTTHFIIGGTVYTTPPRYTTPGDKFPKPKILSTGVWDSKLKRAPDGVHKLKRTPGAVLAFISQRGGAHVSPAEVLARLGSTEASMIALACPSPCTGAPAVAFHVPGTRYEVMCGRWYI